jgi:hypothetical protein
MDKGASNYYFGMELCDVNLGEYLEENNGFLPEYEARIVLR